MTNTDVQNKAATASRAGTHAGNRSRWLVATLFGPTQVGYLDFQYRIRSLYEHRGAHVVTNRPEMIPELGIPADAVTHITGSSLGFRAVRAYARAVSALCEREGYTHVLLLSSAFAPFIGLFSRCHTVLYWNEHPTHLYPTVTRGPAASLKSMKNAVFRRLAYRGARRASIVMPIGEFQQEELLRRGFSSEQVRMVYMGVADLFAPSESVQEVVSEVDNDGPLRVIHAGSVVKERGRDVMLEAVALARKRGVRVHLSMVGVSPPQLEICREAAERLDILDSVDLLGRVPGSEIPSYLHRSDFGLCIWEDKPYYRFNPPTKLFEYLVAGLPVIANNIRTHTHYIRDSENGFICDYSAESLAETIERAASQSEDLPAMKQRARASGELYRWSTLERAFLEKLD